jgi:hypothetical protein
MFSLSKKTMVLVVVPLGKHEDRHCSSDFSSQLARKREEGCWHEMEHQPLRRPRARERRLSYNNLLPWLSLCHGPSVHGDNCLLRRGYTPLPQAWF